MPAARTPPDPDAPGPDAPGGLAPSVPGADDEDLDEIVFPEAPPPYPRPVSEVEQPPSERERPLSEVERVSAVSGEPGPAAPAPPPSSAPPPPPAPPPAPPPPRSAAGPPGSAPGPTAPYEPRPVEAGRFAPTPPEARPPHPPRPPIRFPAAPERRPGRRWALPVAALAAAATLSAGVLVVDEALEPPNPFLEGGTTFPATGAGPAVGASATVRLVRTGTGTAVVLEPEGLAAAAEGAYYAAWLRAPGGETVPLGSFHERRTGIPIILWSAEDPAGYPELFVTLQQRDDPPTPTGPIVLTARLS